MLKSAKKLVKSPIRENTKGHPMKLGEILVMNGKIEEDQLVHGLMEQKKTGEQLGETLIRLGYLTRMDLNKALDVQHESLMEEARKAGLIRRSRRRRVG